MTSNATMPKVVRGYELGDRIGEGGYGAVYRAYQAVVDREVAIKVILPEYADDPDFIRSFEAEARLIAHLEHPFIVPLFDYWREPDGTYLVMRYFQAGNLKRYLRKERQIPLEKVAELLLQIGGALETAHRHDIIHCDIKPENILLDEEANGYLADFGIAKRFDKNATHQAEFSGTLAYAAPEGFLSLPQTPQSDIYSLGIMLYELITGQHPFYGESMMELVSSHLEKNLPMIPDVPGSINDLIQKATHKTPDQRFDSTREMAREFVQRLQTAGASTGKSTSQIIMTDELITNPYKGLRPFDEADALDFFGREALIAEILAQFDGNQRWNRFLAVVGPSGSGKSSVVLAGALPAIRAGKIPGSQEWFVLNMTPGAHPLFQLKTALLSIAIDPNDTLSGRLSATRRGLTEALEEVLDVKQDVLLVIDQFEEVFTLVEDEQERLHFLELLYEAVTNPNSRLHVIITLRADFYDKPLLYENFGVLMQARTQVVLPLSTAELEQAITGPARRVGLTCDTDLVAAVVADVRQEPGALPLLQYALTEVFAQREGNRLNLAAYEKSGRVLGALARRAEEVFSGLSANQQKIAQQIFMRLVAPGEGTEDTRRRARYSELVPNKDERATVQAVLDAFGKYRLLTFDNDPETREPTIEVAHEALIREWQRLRGWLDLYRHDIRQQRMLALAATDWQSHWQDASYLLKGARLLQFEEWAKSTTLALSQAEQTFLDTSIQDYKAEQARETERQRHELELERRARRRLQAILGVLVVASIIGIGLTLLALNQRQNALNARERAEANAQEAQEQRDNAQAQQAIAIENENRANKEREIADSLRSVAQAQKLAIEGRSREALTEVLKAFEMEGAPPEALDALIDIAYKPGIRHLLDVDPASEDPVKSVALSPDGRYVLSATGVNSNQNQPPPQQPPPPPGGGSGQPPQPPPQQPTPQSTTSGLYQVSLWDWASGEQKHLLLEQSTGFTQVAFLPNSDPLQAFTLDEAGKLVLWEVEARQMLRELPLPPATHYAMSLNAEGTRLLVCGSGETTPNGGFQILWDMTTQEPLEMELPAANDIWLCVLSPSGTVAVSGYADETAGTGKQIVWNTTTGAVISEFSISESRIKLPAYTIVISPDDSTVALTLGNKPVYLYDVQVGIQVGRIGGATEKTQSLFFSTDGQYLTVVAANEIFQVWDIEGGTVALTLRDGGASFNANTYSGDGTQLVTGSENGELRLWMLVDSRPREVRRIEDNTAKKAAFLGDGSQILTFGVSSVTNSVNSQLTVWDVATGELVRTFGEGANVFMPQALAVSADGKIAITGTVNDAPGMPRQPNVDDDVLVWNVETGEQLASFETDRNVVSLAIDPTSTGPYLGALPAGGIVGLWELETGTLVRELDTQNRMVRAVAFSPDGQWVAAMVDSRKVYIFDVATGETVKILDVGAFSEVLVFSPDGKTLAVATDGVFDIVLWDIASATEVGHLHKHESVILSFAFSPDGTQAISGARDNTLIQWDLENQRPLRQYTEPASAVWDVDYTRDGLQFLSAADESGLIVWRGTPILLDEVEAWIAINRYLPTE